MRFAGRELIPGVGERIGALDFDDFAVRVRAGYRSAYLHELARKVAAGEVDLGAWLGLEGDAFYRSVKSLKGFGDYASGTVARMYGHFDRIAIDTAAHTMFAERHNGGVKAAWPISRRAMNDSGTGADWSCGWISCGITGIELALGRYAITTRTANK